MPTDEERELVTLEHSLRGEYFGENGDLYGPDDSTAPRHIAERDIEVEGIPPEGIPSSYGPDKDEVEAETDDSGSAWPTGFPHVAVLEKTENGFSSYDEFAAWEARDDTDIEYLHGFGPTKAEDVKHAMREVEREEEADGEDGES